MTCQNLFSGKNKKNISICHLMKFLSRVLRVNPLVLSIWGKKFCRFHFYFFPEDRHSFLFFFFLGDNLHEMSKPVFWEK